MPISAKSAFGTLLCLSLAVGASCGGGGGAESPPTQPPAVSGVALSSTTQSISGVGADITLTATLQPANAVGSVTWSSDNPLIATVIASGLSATIHAVSAGTTRIVARVGSLESASTITVLPIVRTISLPTDTVRLIVGATSTIVPVVAADAGANATLTYASAPNTVATISTTGVITALAPGVSVITVSSNAFPNITATIPVRVTLPTVTIALSPLAPSLLSGSTRQITATVVAPAGVNTGVVWTTVSSAIAKVSETGLVSAVAVGQTTITATSVANSAVSASTLITVTAPTVRSIALAPTTANVFVGTTKMLTVTIDADAGANSALTWSTSSSAVATVSSTGIVAGVGVGGPVTITATSTLVPTVKATVQITVLAAPGATSFTVSHVGTAPYLGGLGTFSLQSTSVNGFLLGIGTQGGGGGTFLNAVLQMNGGVVQNVTPACCSTAGLPDVIAAQSSTDALVAFSGDNIYAHISARVFRQSGSAFNELPSPPGVVPGALSFDRVAAARAVGNGVYNVISNTGVLSHFENGAWTQFATVSGPPGFTTLSGMVSWHRDSVIVAYCANGTATDTPTLIRIYGGTQTSVLGVAGSCGTLRGVRSDSLFAATQAGLAVWNGSSWRIVASGLSVSDTLMDATTCGATRYALSRNGNVYSNQGNTMTRIATDGDVTALTDGTGFFSRIDCAPEGTLRVASGGALISRRAGNTWVEENYAPTTRAVHLASATNGYMVGEGVIYRWNGSSWTLLQRTVASRAIYTQVYTQPDGGMIATGSESNDVGGRAYSMRYLNGTFTPAFGADFNSFLSMAGVGNGVAYAVGRRTSAGLNGILKMENGSWTEIVGLGAGASLIAASAPDNVIAIGVGYGQRFNGTNWNTIPSPPITPTVLRVLSPTFAAAADQCGVGASRVYAFNGVAWSPMAPFPVADTPCLRVLFGTSSTDMYALTASFDRTAQRMFRWNGATWTEIPAPNMFLASDASAVSGFTAFSGYRGFTAFGTAPDAPAVRSSTIKRR